MPQLSSAKSLPRGRGVPVCSSIIEACEIARFCATGRAAEVTPHSHGASSRCFTEWIQHISCNTRI